MTQKMPAQPHDDPSEVPQTSPNAAQQRDPAGLVQNVAEERTSRGDSCAPTVVSEDDGQFNNAASNAESLTTSLSTMTLEPSFCHTVEEDGRTYRKYKEGKYWLPNEAMEKDRLELQHQVFCYTVGGKLNICPLPERPKRVLDIVTGTGIWAMEFASQYPETEVIGSNLSPVQPEYTPKNCRFEIDAVEGEWSYIEPFTFIHGRALMSSLDDPAKVIQQAYKNLEPGGLLEFQDIIIPMNWVGKPLKESALYRWNQLLLEGTQTLGRSWCNVVNYPKFFKEAGFVDIVEQRYFWPVSPWAKDTYFKTLATYVQEDLIAGLDGINMRALQATGMTTEEILDFSEEVKADCMNTDLHAYIPISFVYGRKPVA